MEIKSVQTRTVLVVLVTAMILGLFVGCNLAQGDGTGTTGTTHAHGSWEAATTATTTEPVPTGTGESQVSLRESNPYRTDPELMDNSAYYGTFNGWNVIRDDGGIAGYVSYATITVAGYRFRDATGRLKCKKGEESYSLSQAYEKGILTEEHIAYLSDYLRDIQLHFYIYVGLDATQEYRIKKAYLNTYYPNGEYTVNDLYVRCLQQFDDSTYAVVVKIKGMVYSQDEIVDSSISKNGNPINFRYPTEWRILICSEGVCYTIPQAYDLEILTAEELGAFRRDKYFYYTWQVGYRELDEIRCY